MDFLNSRRKLKRSIFCSKAVSRRLQRLAVLTRLFVVISMATLGSASLSVADEQEGAGPGPPTVTYIEAGADFTHFTNDYGNGNNQFLAVLFDREWSYLLRFDLGRSERFGDTGLGAGASFTGYLTRRWSARAGINTGSGEFILPRYRLSAAIGRAFLAERNLNAEIGYIHDQSRGENSFDRIAPSVIWYAGSHWMLSAYFNYDIGQPGSTKTMSGILGVTWYRWRDRHIGGTLEYGDVNYIQVGPMNYLVSLTETLLRIYYTEYLNPKFGFIIRLDLGTNDFYNHVGASFSLFKEW